MDGVTFDALRYRSGEATGEGLGEGQRWRSDPRARGITRLRNAENLWKLGIRQGQVRDA
jgi:hypothetical protein